MEKIAEQDGAESDTRSKVKQPDEEKGSKMKVLEEISYCLSVAKRLVDIELGRIPH